MKIIGIDPGLQHTGWGIIELKGNKLSHIAHGVINTNASAKSAERLKHIFIALRNVIAEFSPNEAAVEEVFVNMNPASSLKLGLARGTALLAPAMEDIPVFEYTPNLIKKSVVGSGHAQKEQISAMVKILLGGVEAKADAADALAVAICHAHHK